MSTERSTVMYATRLPKHGGGTYLAGFMHSEQVAKICFYKPVERVAVRDMREGETSECWAWWDAKDGRFDFVFASWAGVEMCFPYGSEVERKKGNGEVVNVAIEESK